MPEARRTKRARKAVDRLEPANVMRCSLTANDDVFKSSGQARDGHLSAVVRHVQQPVTVAVSVAPVTVAPGRVRQSVASWCGSTKTPGSEDQPEDSAATPAKQGPEHSSELLLIGRCHMPGWEVCYRRAYCPGNASRNVAVTRCRRHRSENSLKLGRSNHQVRATMPTFPQRTTHPPCPPNVSQL
jgi:hypothetical protein